MDRRSFIFKSCAACIGATVFSGFMESCKSVAYATGSLTDNGLKVPLKDFQLRKGGYHSYVIIRHESLQYPICVYRFTDKEYAALWMQCSHQGAELQVNGERLTCPAHGSEFDRRGIVQQGPAATALRSFPIQVNEDHLFIDLRKQA